MRVSTLVDVKILFRFGRCFNFVRMQHLQDLSRACPWEGVMLTFYLFETVLLKIHKVDQTTPFIYNLLRKL